MFARERNFEKAKRQRERFLEKRKEGEVPLAG